MPKITSDGKLIFVGHKSCNIKSLTEDDWAFIENESKFPLTPKLRSQLNQIVSLYVTSGPGSLETVTAKSLISQFDVWKSRTNLFREEQLSKTVREQQSIEKSTAAKPLPLKKSQPIVDKYFTIERYSKPTPTADDIAHMLDGAKKLAGAMISQLTAEGSVRVTRKKFWLVWIALLICLFRSHKISISWQTGKKKGINKRFVGFVKELQTFLPSECKPRNKFTSIHKGIIQALPLARHKPIQELKVIMRHWGQGRFEIYNEVRGYGFENPTMWTLARLLEKIDVQSRK